MLLLLLNRSKEEEAHPAALQQINPPIHLLSSQERKSANGEPNSKAQPSSTKDRLITGAENTRIRLFGMVSTTKTTPPQPMTNGEQNGLKATRRLKPQRHPQPMPTLRRSNPRIRPALKRISLSRPSFALHSHPTCASPRKTSNALKPHWNRETRRPGRLELAA